MNAVIEELDANAVALSGYIDSLQGLLIGLYDADVWEMSEWDWQWPEHRGPHLPRTQLNAAAPHLPPRTVAALQASYAKYARPPALDGWASKWDGSETLFLRFMLDKLEEYRADAHSCFEAARRALLQSD